MGNKGVTLRGRILQAIIEIIVGIVLIIFLSFVVIYFLYDNRVINSVSIKDELDYNLIQNENGVTKYLDEIKVNYVFFDKLGQIKKKYISDSNLIIARESFNSNKAVNTISGEYLFFENINGFVVIRIPYVPEFTNIELEEKNNFNTLFNNILLFLCFLISIISSIRLLQQTKNEFLALENSILGSIENDLPANKSVKIIEIQKSIEQVNYMKRILVDLIEKEKSQKKDLLFQTSALSHDIKTPLTIIKGNVGLLEYCDNEEEVEECIRYINSGVETIEDYLDQMISYAKLSYYPEEKRDIEISELINGILKNIDGYKKNIKFELKYEFEDHNIKIFCSKSNIERAVVNLLMNAFQHAKNKVILRITSNESMKFRVYNDGENMSEETMKNIGKLFFTDDKRRDNKYRHYGIGLYFAKKMAIEHGGDLKGNNLVDGVEFILEVQSKRSIT